MHLPYNLAKALLGIHQREEKAYVHTKSCTWMFTKPLFINSQHKCLSTGEQENKLWYICTMKTRFCSKKEWNIDIPFDMNESKNNYVEWKELDRKGYCTAPFIYSSRKWNSCTMAKSRSRFAWDWGKKKEELQRVRRKVLGMIDMFIILNVVMALWI